MRPKLKMKMNFGKDYQGAVYLLCFISLILVPIQWEFKLLIASMILLFETIISSKLDLLKDLLISIAVNTEILWQSRSEEEIDKAFDAMDKESEVSEKVEAKFSENIHAELRPKLYLYLFLGTLFLATTFYLSEHWL